jgi:hypothetical protein
MLHLIPLLARQNTPRAQLIKASHMMPSKPKKDTIEVGKRGIC